MKSLTIGSDGVTGSHQWYNYVRPAVKHVFGVYGIADRRGAKVADAVDLTQFESFLLQDWPVDNAPSSSATADSAANSLAVSSAPGRGSLMGRSFSRSQSSTHPLSVQKRGLNHEIAVRRVASDRGFARATAGVKYEEQADSNAASPEKQKYGISPGRAWTGDTARTPSRRFPKAPVHTQGVWDGLATSGWDNRTPLSPMHSLPLAYTLSPRTDAAATGADAVTLKRPSPYGIRTSFGPPVRAPSPRSAMVHSPTPPLTATTSLPALVPLRRGKSERHELDQTDVSRMAGARMRQYEEVLRRYGVPQSSSGL
jgi:hypothetical protein